MQAPQSTN